MDAKRNAVAPVWARPPHKIIAPQRTEVQPSTCGAHQGVRALEAKREPPLSPGKVKYKLLVRFPLPHEFTGFSHFLGLDHFSGKQKVLETLFGQSTRSELSYLLWIGLDLDLKP